jgi:hypothetical protein
MTQLRPLKRKLTIQLLLVTMSIVALVVLILFII